MNTDMTITVPTGEPGEVAYFKIGFEKSRFDEVLETIDLLIKPTDVVIAESWGIWKII